MLGGWMRSTVPRSRSVSRLRREAFWMLRRIEDELPQTRVLRFAEQKEHALEFRLVYRGRLPAENPSRELRKSTTSARHFISSWPNYGSNARNYARRRRHAGG